MNVRIEDRGAGPIAVCNDCKRWEPIGRQIKHSKLCDTPDAQAEAPQPVASAPELAQTEQTPIRIAALMEAMSAEGFTPNLWQNHGKIRVYVKQGRVNCGYVSVYQDGSIGSQSWDKRRFDLERIVGDHIASYGDPFNSQNGPRGLSNAEIRRRAKEGSGLTDDEIFDAHQRGLISTDEAMNRDD